jgi:hypothetical protein
LQKRFGRTFKIDDDADHDIDDERDDERDNGNGNDEPRHIVDELADLLVEGGSPDGEVTREQALQWLLHSERGQALVARMVRARKRDSNRKDSSMTRTETLTRIVKQAGGLGPLCRKIVKRGTTDVLEAELTGMITAAAVAEYPNLTSEAAFAKLYTGPNGEDFRRAVAVARAAQFANSAYPYPR